MPQVPFLNFQNYTREKFENILFTDLQFRGFMTSHPSTQPLYRTRVEENKRTIFLYLVLNAMLKSCLRLLYVGPCHVVSAETTVAMAVLIENLADYEVRGAIRFLQTDEILGYLAEEARSRVELFCCMTIHVRILPGRH